MLDLLPAIAQRRSVRSYQDRPVDPQLVETLLEAARLAPAACNLPHFRVLVVDQAEDLAVVRKAAYGIGAIALAPVALVLMADVSVDAPFVEQMEQMARSPNPALDLGKLASGSGRPFELKVGRDWALVNAGIAGEHMALQATALGLATCWVHHFDHGEVRTHFRLPEHLELVSLMAVGYGAAEELSPVRRGGVRYEVAS